MFLSVITKNLNWEILHFMWIISSHQAEFSYPAFFELVWLTLAPINIYIIYRSNIYMTPAYLRSNK